VSTLRERLRSRITTISKLWNWGGALQRIHHALYVAVREEEGREASPTVAIIDSQTAKGNPSDYELHLASDAVAHVHTSDQTARYVTAQDSEGRVQSQADHGWRA
jgi:hypothetical protein